jgi:hypothetical protein
VRIVTSLVRNHRPVGVAKADAMTPAKFSGVTLTPIRTAATTAARVITSLPRSAVRFRPAPWCVLVCSGLSPVLLTGAWLIGDALQPVSYSPIRQTVSVMSGYGGTDRWIVTSALVVIGVCYFLTAAGASALSLAAQVGLLVAGLSSIGIAACPEPAHGATAQHAVYTGIGAVAIAIWPALVVRRGQHSSALVRVRMSATVTVVFLALLGWLVLEAWRGGAVGLAERVVSSIEICWPFVVALALYRGTARDRRSPEVSGQAAELTSASPLS